MLGKACDFDTWNEMCAIIQEKIGTRRLNVKTFDRRSKHHGVVKIFGKADTYIVLLRVLVSMEEICDR